MCPPCSSRLECCRIDEGDELQVTQNILYRSKKCSKQNRKSSRMRPSITIKCRMISTTSTICFNLIAIRPRVTYHRHNTRVIDLVTMKTTRHLSSSTSTSRKMSHVESCNPVVTSHIFILKNQIY